MDEVEENEKTARRLLYQTTPVSSKSLDPVKFGLVRIYNPQILEFETSS